MRTTLSNLVKTWQHFVYVLLCEYMCSCVRVCVCRPKEEGYWIPWSFLIKQLLSLLLAAQIQALVAMVVRRLLWTTKPSFHLFTFLWLKQVFICMYACGSVWMYASYVQVWTRTVDPLSWSSGFWELPDLATGRPTPVPWMLSAEPALQHFHLDQVLYN